MDDLISRQAAIDALGGNEPVGDPSKMDDDDVVKMWERIRIINIINKLPSAQPDLSEYSDKLWRNAYERGKRDAQAELPIKKKCTVCPHCDNCDVNDDGTITQPQPKTGKWINGHWDGDSNFRIDGRGNCWYVRECSNCHEEIEGKPTNYCPYCGAKMMKDGD